jgi:hypothetical protein
VLRAKSAQEYGEAVNTFLDSRAKPDESGHTCDDATRPTDGWPWPWDTSATSDCSYWFFEGAVWDANYPQEEHGIKRYCRCDREPVDDQLGEKIEFPDMTTIQRVTYGDRSGLIVL